MIKEVIMPKLGQTMEEGTIERWFKQEGDRVEKGEVLLEITTDKATLEVEATASGILKKIVVPEGEAVPVKEVIAYLGEEADEIPEVAPPRAEIKEAEEPGKAPASPRARRLAREKGIDLSKISGSGPGGKITEEDVISYVGGAGALPAAERKRPDEATRVRRLIARRVSLSKASIPHFYVTAAVDMTACRELREKTKKAGKEISYHDFIIRAAALSLKEVPQVNALWENDAVRLRPEINIGVIVALDEGVIVPVVSDAAGKSLEEISQESRGLIVRARKGELLPDEFSLGTFTVSNLGMLGVENFFAVINPGESAILALGEMKDSPAVVDGRLAIRALMKISLSCDHRVVDGGVAGKFLRKLKNYLEDPKKL